MSARLRQLLAEPLCLNGLSDTLPGTTGIVSHYYYLYFLYFFLILCQWKRMISEFSTKKKREWYHLALFTSSPFLKSLFFTNHLYMDNHHVQARRRRCVSIWRPHRVHTVDPLLCCCCVQPRCLHTVAVFRSQLYLPAYPIPFFFMGSLSVRDDHIKSRDC